MMRKLEHLGFAVKNLGESDKLYTRLLGLKPYKHEAVPGEKVNTSFYQVGEVKLELLEASNDDSAIAKFIGKKGEGLHHIAFEVQDIELEAARLRKEGFQLLYDSAKPGADNKLVNFVHPKSAGGVLIELCQDIG